MAADSFGILLAGNGAMVAGIPQGHMAAIYQDGEGNYRYATTTAIHGSATDFALGHDVKAEDRTSVV